MKATVEFLTLCQTIPFTDSHESEFRGAQGILCPKGYLMRGTASGPLPLLVLRTFSLCVAGASKDLLKRNNDFCLSKTIPYSSDKMPCHETRDGEHFRRTPFTNTNCLRTLSLSAAFPTIPHDN